MRKPHLFGVGYWVPGTGCGEILINNGCNTLFSATSILNHKPKQPNELHVESQLSALKAIDADRQCRLPKKLASFF
jgi:hypothetical protein